MASKLVHVFLLSLLILIIEGSQLKNLEGKAQCTNQTYRPRYHFSPARNWLNDPNGMIYYDGVYHLYFQYHPYSSVWGPMHWAHAESRDLFTWEEKDIALYPDDLGLIFSGSAVADTLNTTGFKQDAAVDPIVAIYTSASGPDNIIQRQSIAYSLDKGLTFTKYEKNPVLSDPTKRDFRDPKVFFHEGLWFMTLAVSNRVEFFASPDLKDWTYQSEFGREVGHHGGVFECPDLLRLRHKDDDGVERDVWVLIVSINPGGPNQGSATQYFVGNFEKSNETGKYEFLQFEWNSEQWLDWGPDNYAGVTFANHHEGRWIYMGWMNNWFYATELPTNTWRGQVTLPRELTVRQMSKNQYRIVSTPVKELEGLRHPFEHDWVHSEFVVPPQTVIQLNERASFSSPLMELEITLEMSTTSTNFSICGYNDDQEETCFGHEGGHWFLDRSKSGNTNFSPNFQNTLKAYATRVIKTGAINIKMYFDVSSVEVFVDDGMTTLTSLHYPTIPFEKIYLNNWSEGSSNAIVTVKGFDLWGLQCWYPPIDGF